MLESNLEADMGNPTCEHILVLKTCCYGDNIFPSLNNLISEAERHPMSYNRLKKQLEFVVINAVRLQLKGWKATKRVQIHYVFGERNKGVKRDYDNIQSASLKIIADGLVKAGVLKDDAPKYLAPSTCEFHYVDKPFIKVIIREIENE